MVAVPSGILFQGVEVRDAAQLRAHELFVAPRGRPHRGFPGEGQVRDHLPRGERMHPIAHLDVELGGFDPVNGFQIAGFIHNVLQFSTHLSDQYDLMNRLTNRASAGGLLAAYSYTADGQRQTMIDPSGMSSYIYDVRGRVCTNMTPRGTLYYQYDLNGNLLSDGTRALTYDDENQMISVIVSNGLSASTLTTNIYDG